MDEPLRGKEGHVMRSGYISVPMIVPSGVEPRRIFISLSFTKIREFE